MPDATVTSSRPRAGLLSWIAGDPGFYVVNRETNIAVHRAQTRALADAHIRAVDARYPGTPRPLVVVEVRS